MRPVVLCGKTVILQRFKGRVGLVLGENRLLKHCRRSFALTIFSRIISKKFSQMMFKLSFCGLFLQNL